MRYRRAVFILCVLILIMEVRFSPLQSAGLPPRGSAVRLRQGDLLLAAEADSIPPIDLDPDMLLPADSPNVPWRDSDLVITVLLNGDKCAYPIPLLSNHEIINDRLGGEPIAVTWCPLCYSPIVFLRRLDQELSFEASDYLYNNNLVMRDHQTGTLWRQLLGVGLRGALRGVRLEVIPAQLVEWGGWCDEYPGTTIIGNIDQPGVRGEDAYTGHYRSSYVGLSGADIADDRLAPKSLIVGITQGEFSAAAPAEAFSSSSLLISISNELMIIITHREEQSAPAAYRLEAVRLRDSIHAPVGIPSGERLILHSQRIPVISSYWFAWLDHHPQTSLYLP